MKVIARGQSLAESPGYNAYDGCHFWVDIDRDSLVECNSDGQLASKHLDSGITSAHAIGGGEYLATGRSSIFLLRNEKKTELLQFDGFRGDRRFNDSYITPSGALLVGTKDTSSNDSPQASVGVLKDGVFSWITHDLSLANGMDFDSVRRRLYCADSLNGRIVFWDLQDSEVPTHEDNLLVFPFDFEGEPDGLCLDDSGNLLVAVWGAGTILYLGPNGEKLGEIRTRARHVTSIAFTNNGPGEVLVTSASIGQEEPLEGFDLPLYPGEVGLFNLEDYLDMPRNIKRMESVE